MIEAVMRLPTVAYRGAFATLNKTCPALTLFRLQSNSSALHFDDVGIVLALTGTVAGELGFIDSTSSTASSFLCISSYSYLM